VYYRDWGDTHDGSGEVGGLPSSAQTARQHLGTGSNVEEEYAAPRQARHISTDEFEKDRNYFMDSSNAREASRDKHDCSQHPLSKTTYQTFIPDTLYSNHDWALYHLQLKRLSRHSPITVDFEYAGSVDPDIPIQTYKSTHEPGFARIESLIGRIKDVDPPFDGSRSFRTAQVCLEELERAAEETGDAMRAEGSIQIEKLVNICPREDRERGVGRCTHNAWVSVKPLIRR